MAVQIQLRRDTAANWTSADPTLAAGEFGYETDSTKFKIGDGATAWTLLDYASAGTGDLLAANNLSDLASASTARTNLGLGTAATTASTDYATAAQGAKADSAAQFSGDVTGSDSKLTRTMLIDCGATYVDKGNSGTSTQTLDYTAGSAQKITATGNFTIATSNWPPTGNLGAILLEAVNFGANTVTWPTINWVMPDGTTTTSISTWLAASTGRTAFQSSGTDLIKLISRDAGTTIYGGWAL